MELNYLAFEAYLRGELKEEDRSTFETSLRADKHLYEAFKLYEMLRKNISAKLLLDDRKRKLKSKLEGLGSRYFVERQIDAADTSNQKEVSKVIGFRKYLIPFAASLLIICSAAIGLNMYAKSNFGIDAIVALFEEESVRSAGTLLSSDEELIEQSIVAFQNEGAPNHAIELLSQIQKDSPVFDRAQWLTAKFYIATEQSDKAKAILYDLSSRDNVYRNNAKAVIEKLESFMHRVATF